MIPRSIARTLSALLALGAAYAASAQVVISQIYTTGGQAGAVYRNDYVELHNRSGAPINLIGWSLQFASASGTFGFPQLTTGLGGVIPANGYFLVQLASTTSPGDGVLLPTPDQVGTVNLLGASGKLALVAPPFPLINPVACPLAGFGVVDFVGYGPVGSQPCFEGSGTTGPSLNNSGLAAIRKDGGCQDTNDNANDFIMDAPAPRNSAVTRPPCVGSGPDLAPLAQRTPATSYVGTDNVTLTVDVINVGTAAAANSTVQFTLPPDVTFVSSTPAATPVGNLLTVNLGTIAAFDSATAVIVLTPTAEQAWTATFTAATTSVDASLANNSTSVSVLSLNSSAACQLKVSQVYPGGESSLPGAFYNQDYVELHNAGSTPVLLNGRSVQFRTVQSGSWFKFNLPNLALPPGGFYLLGAASPGATGADLPVTVDGNTSNVVTINEVNGAIVIANTQNFLQQQCFIEDPLIVDLVGWGDPFFICAESFAPVPWVPGDVQNAMLRNSNGCADTGFNLADFTIGTPLPRNTSSSVVLCGGGCNPADICGVGATYDNGAVDIGPDGALTIEDFLNFLAAFGDSTGCPGSAPCNPADICGVGATYDNGTVDIGPDGTLTIEDFLNFLAAFGDSTGCP